MTTFIWFRFQWLRGLRISTLWRWSIKIKLWLHIKLFSRGDHQVWLQIEIFSLCVLHGNLMSIKLFVALLFFIFLPIQKYNKHRSRLIVVFPKKKTFISMIYECFHVWFLGNVEWMNLTGKFPMRLFFRPMRSPKKHKIVIMVLKFVKCSCISINN